MDRGSSRASQVVRVIAACVSLSALAIGLAALAQAQPDASAADTTSAATDDSNAAAAAPRARDRGRASRDAGDAPAAAAAGSPGSTALATPVEPAAETIEAKLVCKSMKPLGTRVAKRVCATPEQWAATDRRTTRGAEEGMRQMRDRNSTVIQPIGGSAP
jgi:hypothetical protein